MIFTSNKTYDILKWLALIVFPALVTLVGSLSDTWGVAYGPQIVATLGAVQLFLAAVLQKSAHDYKNLPADKR